MRVAGDPGLAREILGKQKTNREGWCELVKLQPTKVGGYIQLSHDGVNKFAVLQEVVLWAGGHELAGQQVSHLCHRPACRVVGHVVPESAAENNRRKNCLVWVDCHHCPKKILVCPHRPRCIRYAEGFASMDDLVARGVCNQV